MTIKEKPKKAILFGGSDGHGITMTAISERALKCKGYAVETICRYPTKKIEIPLQFEPVECGTGIPEYFWAFTFTNWDYSNLKKGDIIMIVDTPLPIPQQIRDFSAAECGVEKIRVLCGEGKRVIIIDHHKHSLTHYGKAIDAGAELLFSLGPVMYSHYGIPDDYSLFWGSIGAVCDRDHSMLPVERDERVLFTKLEKRARWLDSAKQNLTEPAESTKNPLNTIRKNRRHDIKYREKNQVDNYSVDRAVTFIPELGKGAFKTLDAACEKTKTPYGVGIGINREGSFFLTVINYWKRDAPPVALKLHKWRDIAGHDNAVTIPMNSRQSAEKNAKKIIDILNSDKINTIGPQLNDPDVVDYLVQAIEKSHLDIPTWLTIHGWPHIETVFANVQLLGTLMNCSESEQNLLNWSALFHDLGNGALQYKEVCRQHPELTVNESEIRKNHHHLTVEILNAWRGDGFCKGSLDDNYLISDRDFQLICDICFRHRKNSETHPDPEIERLCALMRIADALDQTKNRARKNDSGRPASEIIDKLRRENPNDIRIAHWKGQLAIETIRLHVRQKNNQNHITFEFFITNRKKAEFMINDFKKELKGLDKNIATWDIRTVLVPLFN